MAATAAALPRMPMIALVRVLSGERCDGRGSPIHGFVVGGSSEEGLVAAGSCRGDSVSQDGMHIWILSLVGWPCASCAGRINGVDRENLEILAAVRELGADVVAGGVTEQRLAYRGAGSDGGVVGGAGAGDSIGRDAAGARVSDGDASTRTDEVTRKCIVGDDAGFANEQIEVDDSRIDGSPVVLDLRDLLRSVAGDERAHLTEQFREFSISSGAELIALCPDELVLGAGKQWPALGDVDVGEGPPSTVKRACRTDSGCLCLVHTCSVAAAPLGSHGAG